MVSRTKKVFGQMASALRAIEEDAHCADILLRLAAACHQHPDGGADGGSHSQPYAEEHQGFGGCCGRYRRNGAEVLGLRGLRGRLISPGMRWTMSIPFTRACSMVGPQ